MKAPPKALAVSTPKTWDSCLYVVFCLPWLFFYKRNVLLISYLGYLTGLDLCWCEVVRFQEIDLIKLYVLWNDCFLCFLTYSFSHSGGRLSSFFPLPFTLW